MNKKIIIILIIIALTIASLTGILIINFKHKKVQMDNEIISEVVDINVIDEAMNSEDPIDEQIEDEIHEETQEENVVESNTQEVVQKVENTPKETPKENKPTTPVKTSNVETPKEQPKVQQEVVQTNVEPKVEEKKPEPKVEEKPQVPQCTETKHSIGVGNTNKWFNSKQEAVSYYDGILKTWGDKWERFEIDSETYDKNCPYRYDVWSCPICGKWTISFYYR